MSKVAGGDGDGEGEGNPRIHGRIHGSTVASTDHGRTQRQQIPSNRAHRLIELSALGDSSPRLRELTAFHFHRLASGTHVVLWHSVPAMTRTIISLAVAFGLAACGSPDSGANQDGGGTGGDLDPANPPPSPFPDNPFPDDGTCGDINAVVDGLIPTVQLLIDQSGSMSQSFGGTDRWGAVYSSIMDNMGVVNTLQSTIRFGLTLYSGAANAGDTCPALDSVAPALGNYAAIDAVYGPASPKQETPTGESLDATIDVLAASTEPGRKIIVLGTDGLPDTCADPASNTDATAEVARQVALTAAERAFDAGIRVYIVSVGNDVGEPHLQDMANAGSGLPVGGTDNAQFFVANSPAELVTAFGTIVGSVAGCLFTINGEVDTAKASQGLVSLDGTPLDFGTEWQMLDGKTFEVLGAACDTIQDGSLHHISAVFPCGVVIID